MDRTIVCADLERFSGRTAVGVGSLQSTLGAKLDFFFHVFRGSHRRMNFGAWQVGFFEPAVLPNPKFNALF
jgi:hypothetical protein